MPLTPADVRNKQFSTTRLRPGYDEEEVDAFLDEIEAELDRLIQENEELRSKLAEATRTAQAGATGGATAVSGADQAVSEDSEPSQPSQPSQAAQPAQSSAAPSGEQPQVDSDAEQAPSPAEAEPSQQPSPAAAESVSLPITAASMGESGDDMQSASRMLALAQQTADQAVADARREADETIGKAQREAEETVGKARRQAEQIMSEARSRAEALERDAQERHRQSMGTLVQQREELEHKLDDLRAFESEYRTRLKDYFERQLRDLEAGASDGGPLPSTGGTAGEASALPASEARNGQLGGVNPSSPRPFGAPETAQHATSSGIRSSSDNTADGR